VFLPVDPLLRFRLLGMSLAMRVSCLVTLVLVTGGVLARIDGGLDARAGRLTWGIATAICTLLLFVTLLVHEAVRHQAAAWLGVTERRIDLYLFGGSPEIVDDTATPRSEVVAGIAGLLALALIAGLCAVLTFATRTASVHVHLPAKTLALAVGALALVQITPALPLDGGRVFRAFVWYMADSPAAGVKAAALYAQLLAAALIAGGLILLGATGAFPFWGLGAAVIGVHLGSAARHAVHRSSWQRISRSLTVRDALPASPPSLAATTVIDDAVERLIHEGMEIPLLVVGPDRQPLGVIRLANLRRVRRTEWTDRTVAEIMTPTTDLPRMSGDLTVFDAVARLDDARQSLGLIVDGDGAIAPVSRDQLIHRLFDRARRPANPR
jgi:CBS domain-containing protein